MGSILSGISGYFSKYLILGTFLPVVVFVILNWLFAIPLLPVDWPILKPLEAFDTQWKILAISFVTIVLTGILYNINIPLIRVYEGYPWQEFWIGQWRTNKYKRIFKIAEAQWKGMPHLEYELSQKKDPRYSEIMKKRHSVGRKLFSDFPTKEDLILPTLLGNVIRSFESYAYRQYNMEAVTLWPRLVAKIDKDYATGIQDTKTSFDFMLNCSMLSTLLAASLLIIGLIYPVPFNSTKAALMWLIEIIIFSALAYIFYSLSIDRARAWGNTVRTTFDLYRFDLLKQLGYQRLPTTLNEERELWRSIGERMIYGDHYLLPPAEYSSASTFVGGESEVARFTILRGIDPPETGGQSPALPSTQILIKIHVKNVGHYDADTVIVTDTLAENLVYKWNSASVVNPDSPNHSVTVTGTNPYKFNVGRLVSKHDLVLSYCAVPFNQGSLSEKDEDKNESFLLLNGNLLAYNKASVTGCAPKANTAEDLTNQSSSISSDEEMKGKQK